MGLPVRRVKFGSGLGPKSKLVEAQLIEAPYFRTEKNNNTLLLPSYFQLLPFSTLITEYMATAAATSTLRVIFPVVWILFTSISILPSIVSANDHTLGMFPKILRLYIIVFLWCLFTAYFWARKSDSEESWVKTRNLKADFTFSCN